MKTFYLIDFENVSNDGIENIGVLSSDDHVHIFSTENALNIRMDLVFSKKIHIQGHIVPVRKQSLDMHLVSYLGYLLGIHGNKCAYVIISRDSDYDNIIKFWQDEGYENIVRKAKILGKTVEPKKTVILAAPSVKKAAGATNVKKAKAFSGEARSELNSFMQHNLVELGYTSDQANRICKFVIAHCNEEHMLREIHNDLQQEFENYAKMYEDVRNMLRIFIEKKNKLPNAKTLKDKLSKTKPQNTKPLDTKSLDSKVLNDTVVQNEALDTRTSDSMAAKREMQIRSFWGQHFGKKKYADEKEEMINLLVKAQTRQQVNNGLLKIFLDGNVVKHIYKTIQPLIKDLPGK